jgi:hypothetical protein
MFKRLVLLTILTLAAAGAHAAYQDPEIELSTDPIGSSYYRHLARESNIDLRELVKFERRGFGRTEINILILISSGSVQTLKDFGNRRLKEKTSLEEMVRGAGFDFDTVYVKARELKTTIEAMGDNDLPPPVFEATLSTATVSPKLTKEEKRRLKKERKEKRAQEETSPLDVPRMPLEPEG